MAGRKIEYRLQRSRLSWRGLLVGGMRQGGFWLENVCYHYTRRIPSDYREWRDVFDYYTARRDYCALTHSHPFHDVNTMSDPGVAANTDGLNIVERWRKTRYAKLRFDGMRIGVSEITMVGDHDAFFNHDLFVYRESNHMADVNIVLKNQTRMLVCSAAADPKKSVQMNIVADENLDVGGDVREQNHVQILSNRLASPAEDRLPIEESDGPVE